MVRLDPEGGPPAQEPEASLSSSSIMELTAWPAADRVVWPGGDQSDQGRGGCGAPVFSQTPKTLAHEVATSPPSLSNWP